MESTDSYARILLLILAAAMMLAPIFLMLFYVSIAIVKICWPPVHTQWEPLTPDFDYFKKFYDVMLPDGTIVEQCWPNSGYMCAINGDNRKFGPKDNVKVRLSRKQPMDDD